MREGRIVVVTGDTDQGPVVVLRVEGPGITLVLTPVEAADLAGTLATAVVELGTAQVNRVGGVH